MESVLGERTHMCAADDVKISGSAGLGIGPAIFYNRGTCSVQVRRRLSMLVAWLEWPLWMLVQAAALCVALLTVHPLFCLRH